MVLYYCPKETEIYIHNINWGQKNTVKCFYFVIQYSCYKLSIWKVEVKKLSKAHNKGIWLPEAVLMPLVQVHFLKRPSASPIAVEVNGVSA